MKLGIVTDIHAEAGHLRRALETFRSVGVEQVVMLGDVCCMGECLPEPVEMLAAAGAVGVWGNHDFGLCRNPPESVRQKYAGPILDYMSKLRPRLELGDCLFTHVEPWLDTENVLDLWYYGGVPETAEEAARSFDAVPQRFLFAGHIHRWRLLTPQGLADWQGERPIRLEADRNLVFVAAVCDGRFATFDTGSGLLTPYDVGRGPTA